jgi:Asparagine synthase
MAHSIEGRFPFLNYRVEEFASKLPSMQLVNFCSQVREAGSQTHIVGIC